HGGDHAAAGVRQRAAEPIRSFDVAQHPASAVKVDHPPERAGRLRRVEADRKLAAVERHRAVFDFADLLDWERGPTTTRLRAGLRRVSGFPCRSSGGLPGRPTPRVPESCGERAATPATAPEISPASMTTAPRNECPTSAIPPVAPAPRRKEMPASTSSTHSSK